MFDSFKDAVSSFSGVLDSSFLIDEDGSLQVFYAPFEYVNTNAKIAIVGITPGNQQAVNALSEAKRLLAQGVSTDEILRQAIKFGSFSGPMRNNLVRMMDYFSLNQYLGVDSCMELFGQRDDLVQFLSALPFPVFLKGSNYNGSPNMLTNHLLKKHINNYLVPMVSQLPNTIFIPLGPKVEAVFQYLVKQGIVKDENVLFGFSHPSGANMERILYLVEEKSRESLSIKTNAEKIDNNREQILLKVEKLLG